MTKVNVRLLLLITLMAMFAMLSLTQQAFADPTVTITDTPLTDYFGTDDVYFTDTPVINWSIHIQLWRPGYTPTGDTDHNGDWEEHSVATGTGNANNYGLSVHTMAYLSANFNNSLHQQQYYQYYNLAHSSTIPNIYVYAGLNSYTW